MILTGLNLSAATTIEIPKEELRMTAAVMLIDLIHGKPCKKMIYPQAPYKNSWSGAPAASATLPRGTSRPIACTNDATRREGIGNS